jgi:putative oxidoreductase
MTDEPGPADVRRTPAPTDGAIDPQRLLIPRLARVYRVTAPFAYAWIRFWAGALLIPHGYAKLFQGAAAGTAGTIAKLGLEPALGWAYFLGVVEFFGGILIAIGLLTRLAAAVLAIEFAVIVLAVKWPNGFFAFRQGFEFELLWGLLCLAFVFRGGGRYSADRAIGKEL